MTELKTPATDRIDVAYVARLARLHLTPEEITRFQPQLEEIVGYVRTINAVDLAGVEPLARAVRTANVFREDRVKPGLDRGAVLANAPAVIEDQFQVPKIVE
jgi:aspartyl-tRNA(Asn)/glutamyl-tRNA(Gln) amidotransferase subunit C